MKNFLRLSICLMGLLNFNLMYGQCLNETSEVFAFTLEDTNYEIVKEGKTWVDAANCAKERGGFLTEITSQAEQDSIYHYVLLADIDSSQTIAPDGGPASYIWIGGNDFDEEGTWVWNGDNDSMSVPFFMGDYINGVAIDSAYNNWGGEPDNSGNQDGLALAITDWTWGVAGQWNDVIAEDTLFFIIEYPVDTIMEDTMNTTLYNLEKDFAAIKVYPNPAQDQLYIDWKASTFKLGSVKIVNTLGDVVLEQNDYALNQAINIASLSQGIYFLSVEIDGAWRFYQKVLVN